MPATWFIGDLHFGHQKVSQIRGFSDTSEHDEAIVAKWRRQVHDDDRVFVLGDISSGARQGELAALAILETLPGRKTLIAGNHDSVSSIHRQESPHRLHFAAVFDTVRDYARVRVEREDVLLSHYPYASQGDGPNRGEMRYGQWRLPDLGGRLVHAHTHNADPFNGSPTGREMCVSWDAWRRMVNIGDVARWVKGTG
jgi:calcineurin-like phosphoesterase family protein